MGAFTYVDIFLTKGIEYLLVIDFLLIFVLFWKALSTPVKEEYEELAAESKVLLEDSRRVKEFQPIGPQWVWKWEILEA